MSYRKGRFHCDGEGCSETRRTLPPEWYRATIRGLGQHHYCEACMDRLHRRLLRGQGRAV